MENVNKTLYIPLYGKAYVSRRKLLLRDTRAESIWEQEGFPLRGKAKSKWLAYYMGMRAAVFDRWTQEQMQCASDALVLHLGCGLDSRAERVGASGGMWFDVDFPEVIRERKRYYRETGTYRMIASDIRDPKWLEALPEKDAAIVIMEGISMYLTVEELRAVLGGLKARFPKLHLLMDCYTEFAAKASKYKNPINEVGVTLVHGIGDPCVLEPGTGITFVREHALTPPDMVNQLSGLEKAVFQRFFAGRFSKKLYRLYEFQ